MASVIATEDNIPGALSNDEPELQVECGGGGNSNDGEEDPSKLTKSEIVWAKEIKASIMEEDEILAQTITDLDYAQFAIITKGNLKRAMKMIHNLSTFKKENGGIDTDAVAVDDISVLVEKAIDSIKLVEKTGFIVSFGSVEKEEPKYSASSVIALNLTAFNPRKYKSPEEWKVLFTALYYLCEASSATISDIKKGSSIICDCDLIGYDNYSSDINKYGSVLYQDSYPIRVKEIICLNTPFIFRAIYAIYKPFVSAHTTKVLTMGGSISEVQDKFSPQNLPKRFEGNIGSWEMKIKLIAALQLRYESKATFTL